MRDLVMAIQEAEAILRRHDPNFEQPLRRLSFMQPIDAAIMLLMESGNKPMPEGVLIDLMLAHGVCMTAKTSRGDPRSYIKRSFVRQSVRKKLRFEGGYVSISREYYESIARKR